MTYTGSLRRTSTVRGKQVHAMISILYYTGVRREELVTIQFEHIEKVAEGEIYLHVFGKGNKQRLIPFSEPAFEAYTAYVRFRPECPCKYEIGSGRGGWLERGGLMKKSGSVHQRRGVCTKAVIFGGLVDV